MYKRQIEGNFDDAQTGVKKIFADSDFAEKLSKMGIKLSSANSINIGRLVPVSYTHLLSLKQRKKQIKKLNISLQMQYKDVLLIM